MSNPTNITIQDDRVVINQLTIHDTDVAQYLQEADNKEQALHMLVSLGARAAIASSATLDANVVDRRFDELERRVTAAVDASVERVAAASSELLDEDNGALTTVLSDLRSNMEGELSKHFDPNQRTSVMASVEKMLTEAGQQQQRRLQQVLDNNPNSPLGAVKAEMLAAVHASNEQLRSLFEDLSRTVAVHKGEQQMQEKAQEKSPSKGFSFEELVLERLSHLAGPSHDVPEKVGGTTGVAGTKKGDLLVTYANMPANVNPRLVLEAKDRELAMKKVREELNQAIDNRDAGVALAVFSSQDLAPTTVPFHIIGDSQAVAIYDKDSDDDVGLQVAYLWARWVLQRNNVIDQVEYERIRLAIERLTEALKHLGQMKKENATVASKTDYLARGLTWLSTTVQEQVDDLSAMLATENDIAA